MDQIKRFDMDALPKKESFFLTPLAYLLSFPTVWKRKLKINKTNMDGLSPPIFCFVPIMPSLILK